MIKVITPNIACRINDRAVQIFGTAGVSEEGGLAHSWAWARALRLADGPDEVHRETVAKIELRKHI